MANFQKSVDIVNNYYSSNCNPAVLKNAPKSLVKLLNGAIDADLEANYPEKHQVTRQQMYDQMMTEAYQPNEILLKNCPKISHGFSVYTPQNLDMYRGTNFRGVSRNGKCNW